jgi:hypothetical protein
MRFNPLESSLGYARLTVKLPNTESKHVQLYDAHLENKRAPGPATQLWRGERFDVVGFLQPEKFN